MHWYKSPLLWGLIGLVLLDIVAFIVFINVWTINSYSDKVYENKNNIAVHDVGIILGAGLDENGNLGDFLADRVVGGIELYSKGTVDRLLITGDNGENREDEVSAMLAFLLDKGIPADDIIVDRHGYRTYESCYRAAQIYDINTAVVITQTFHLYRALYLCDSQGIDVVGYAVDRREYDAVWTQGSREVLARVKAWWQTEITKPLPRKLTP